MKSINPVFDTSYKRSQEIREKYERREEKRKMRLESRRELFETILNLSNQNKVNRVIALELSISLSRLLQIKQEMRKAGYIFNRVQIGRPIIIREKCPNCGQFITN